jgi:adenylate kinase
MNREEKIQFQKETEEYFENKRVYDLFEKLMKELLINKPKEPVDYLIQRLKKKDTKRIFITGASGNERKEIALFLAGHNNMTGVSLGDLVQKEIDKKLDLGRKIEKKTINLNMIDDDIVIDIMKKEFIQLEKDNVSYVIEGFPRNRVFIS